MLQHRQPKLCPKDQLIPPLGLHPSSRPDLQCRARSLLPRGQGWEATLSPSQRWHVRHTRDPWSVTGAELDAEKWVLFVQLVDQTWQEWGAIYHSTKGARPCLQFFRTTTVQSPTSQIRVPNSFSFNFSSSKSNFRSSSNSLKRLQTYFGRK